MRTRYIVLVSKTEENERHWGLLRGLVTKSHTVYSWETFGKDLRKTQAKLSAITDILKYKYVLKSWTGSKAVKK